MSIVRIVASAVVLGVVALGAEAQEPERMPDPPYTPALRTCLEKPENQGTMGMVDCMGAETQIWDRRLNREYQATLRSLESETQARLRAAQRLWVQFRDANCLTYRTLTGGSMDALSAADCMMRMTALRALELERMRQ